jgi:hypothetical protein
MVITFQLIDLDHVTNYVDFIFNGKMIWKFQAHELMKHIVYNIWKSIIEK